MMNRKQPSLEELSQMLAGISSPLPSQNPGANAPGASSLADVSQQLGQMAPLPSSNPNDLVPGMASLDDVHGRIAQLLESAPPGGGPSDILSQIPTPKSRARSVLPSAPAAPLPLAPAPSVPTPAGPDDDVKSIMADRAKIRDQQMSMINSQNGDPWIKALAGLGGLGADVLSKNYNNNYMNAATKAYQDPFDQRRALMMKALDTQISDQSPLIALAQARATRDAALTNAKGLIDYKNTANPPLTFGQKKELKGIGNSGSLMTMPDGTKANPRDLKFKQQLIKEAQKSLNTHAMSAGSSMGNNQKKVNQAARLETLLLNPDGSMRNLDSRETEEAAVGLAKLLADNIPASEQIEALVPKTSHGAYQKWIEWYDSDPTGLDQQKFSERLLATIMREKDTANQQLREAKTAALSGHNMLQQYWPEEYKGLIKSYIAPDVGQTPQMVFPKMLRKDALNPTTKAWEHLIVPVDNQAQYDSAYKDGWR